MIAQLTPQEDEPMASHRKTFGPFVLALCAVSALLGSAVPAAAQPKIGVLMPLSGKGASYGAHQQVAIKMFQDLSLIHI